MARRPGFDDVPLGMPPGVPLIGQQPGQLPALELPPLPDNSVIVVEIIGSRRLYVKMYHALPDGALLLPTAWQNFCHGEPIARIERVFIRPGTPVLIYGAQAPEWWANKEAMPYMKG